MFLRKSSNGHKKKEIFLVVVNRGKIKAYGDPYSFDHMFLAAKKFELNEVEPFLHQRIKSKVKRAVKLTIKFFKCLKYALTPTTVEVSRTPYLLGSTNRKK